MLKKLNRNTVSTTQRPVKVLQFGAGNFLRGFADWMIDIMNEQTEFNGSVQVIQPTPHGKADQINAQDGLYHVVLNGIKNGSPVQEARLITCLKEVVNPFVDFQGFLKAAENPDLQFVISNTTEAGISFNANDVSIDRLPETFPGKLTIFLFHRFTFFKGAMNKGLIHFPCELIEKNGEALRSAIFQYIDHWNLPSTFRNWIEANNTFCNTLVDRIVPGFPKDTIQEIQQNIGYEDNQVITAEPFHLWVIEGNNSLRSQFPADKAELQVKWVNDLTPYRTSKVRILNGAHTAMVPVAYLNGFRTVKESIEDSKIGDFVRKTIYDEIIPTLEFDPQELVHFANDVIERFQNPYIRHELISISLNSISKFRVRVLPSILKFIELKKQLPEKLLFSLATLIRFYKGEWSGESIPLNDTPEVLKFFKKIWETGDIDHVVRQTLTNKDFWHIDLTTIPNLEETIKNYLQQIESQNPKEFKLIPTF
jgi:tagaturonate reductase